VKKFGMCVLSLLALSAFASAQMTLYVSKSGNDINPCTQTLPCRTFGGAIPSLSFRTPNITILALDSADYSQSGGTLLAAGVVIDGGAHGAFLSGPNGLPAIRLESWGTFRNLTIIPGTGAGSSGIYGTLGPGAVLTLDHVAFAAPQGNSSVAVSLSAAPTARIDFRHVTVTGGTDGFDLAPLGPGESGPYLVSIVDSSVDVASTGISVDGGAATIRDSSVLNAVNGLIFKVSDLVTTNSILDHTQISGDTTGLTVNAKATVMMSYCLFSLNTVGVSLSGGALQSFDNNAFFGNGSDGIGVVRGIYGYGMK
jgi:hypothetical protein